MQNSPPKGGLFCCNFRVLEYTHGKNEANILMGSHSAWDCLESLGLYVNGRPMGRCQSHLRQIYFRGGFLDALDTCRPVALFVFPRLLHTTVFIPSYWDGFRVGGVVVLTTTQKTKMEYP